MNTKYHQLSLAEREQISQGLWADENFSQIANRIGCETSTISREVWANVKRKRRSYSAIKADKLGITSVALNLLENAIKYTDPGGKVSLSILRKEDKIEIDITDTGRGIPMNEQPYIFDR